MKTETLSVKNWDPVEYAKSQTFEIDNDCIIVKGPYDYCVDLRRCRTPEQILGWLDQLGDKTWCTKDLLLRFMRTAVHHNEIKIHPI